MVRRSKNASAIFQIKLIEKSAMSLLAAKLWKLTKMN
jgi:hypothetical protein